MLTSIKSVNLILCPLIKDNNKYIILNYETNTHTFEICALMGCHAAYIVNSLLTFRDGPATSVRNYHYSLRDNPAERIYHLLRGGNLTSQAGTLVADHKHGILKILHLEMRRLIFQAPALLPQYYILIIKTTRCTNCSYLFLE